MNRQPTSTRTKTAINTDEPLEWFPKRYGPGALPGEGAKNLLGAPNLDTHVLLVREMAQNSWDARGDSDSLQFVMNLRQLNTTQVESLRKQIFVGQVLPSGLEDFLHEDAPWVLEISDRGTVGLGGPVHNHLSGDHPNGSNYINLVLNVGVGDDDPLSGGTYGFGKTVSYLTSRVGTVLIWSRWNSPGGVEDRLVGSAISDGFDMDGYRYTGRHWWGLVTDDGQYIEPLTGEPANNLAQPLFAQGFDTGGTGTSVLVLAPDLEGRTPEEYADLLRDAVVEHLWPKLLQEQLGRSVMEIEIQLNGESRTLPAIENHPTLSGFADCLRVVRATQRSVHPDSLEFKFRVPEVRPVWVKRQDRYVGHLALTRYPIPLGVTEPAHSICIMRNEAELVVKYVDLDELDVEGFQWAGVFKPTVEFDASFAESEPPAHDDWVPKRVKDKARASDVNAAVNRMKQFGKEFTRSDDQLKTNHGPVLSAAVAADALAGLVPDPPGSGPGPTNGDGGGRERKERPRVAVVDNRMYPADTHGWTKAEVDLLVENSKQPSELIDVTIRVATDAGSEDDPDMIQMIGWRSSAMEISPAGRSQVPTGVPETLIFLYRSDVAVDLNVKIVEI